MSLGDYAPKKPGEAQQYLDEGCYPVTVTTFEPKICNNEKRTPMVKFTVQAPNGEISHASFFLTEAAMGHLTSFAIACGLTPVECKAYDPMVNEAHKVLIGRKLVVRVFLEKDREGVPKYSTVDDWEPFGTDMSKLNSPAPLAPPPVPETPF